MVLIQNAVAWSVLILIVSGVACAALSGKVAKWVATFAVAVVGVMNIFLLKYFLDGGEYFRYSMGHYGAPVGNELRSGPLEAAMCVVFCFVMLLSIMGGRKHIEEDIKGKKQNLYYISAIFLLCSMIALVNTNDLFTAYVFIEINTITACGIILAKEGKTALAASTRYLIMSLVGSGMFLIGICIMYGATGHLLMEPIRDFVAGIDPSSREMIPVQVSIALFAVGMALKSALWPFHSWLPEAHSSATATSSALLSGLVLKAYIFLLVKVIYRVLGIKLLSQNPIFDVLLILGAGAMIMGSVNAIREKDLKRMLAYSSVGQIGYIYLGLGMGTLAGLSAAVIQILAHASTKAMLFIASGGIMDVSGGSKKFKDIEGAGKRDLFAGIAFIVGSLSMIGIPLFAGFATKYVIASAAIELAGVREWIAIIAIVVSAILTTIYYVNAVLILFGGKDNSKKPEGFKYSTEYIIAMVVFIVLNIAIGLNINNLIKLVELGFSMFA
ncbi:MAG: proton-conducting transporter membrane subunit [Bacillota bacterium]|nr:proton-conducting transporter membrane subunit [Bacillota bacterium]